MIKLNKSQAIELLFASLLLVVGLVFLLFPAQSVNIVCNVISVALCVAGVAGLVIFFINKTLVNGYYLVGGVTLSVVGVYFLLNPGILQELLFVLFGSIVLVNGTVSLVDALNAFRANIKRWWVPLVSSLITIGLGCFIVFGKTEHIMVFISISLLFCGAMNILNMTVYKRRYKKANEE